MVQCPLHMADEAVIDAVETETEAGISRIYEIGYVIVPTVKEEDLEKIVGGIRAEIEKAGGSFIAEGAPSQTRLAYAMEALEGARKVEYDRGCFGWIKFEAQIAAAHTLEEALKTNKNLMRFIVFRTVREDTRAKMKPPQLREVKRTDVIKQAPRRIEEPSAPVSEEDLQKALDVITSE